VLGSIVARFWHGDIVAVAPFIPVVQAGSCFVGTSLESQFQASAEGC